MILWDNNKDHRANHYETLSGFFKALSKASKSGKGFRIAYSGDASPDAFEAWAKGVWSILDGKKTTYLIIEEYSDCCRGPGLLSVKKDKFHRKLWTQGRKYGAIIHTTSQRPQLVSNDAIGNMGHFWVSNMDFDAAVRLAKSINVKREEIMALQAGYFFYHKKGCPTELQHVFTPRSEKQTQKQPDNPK